MMGITVGATMFFASCQKEEHDSQAFLDLDYAGIKGAMTEAQMTIFNEARERIDDKVIFANGKFAMNIQSGNEIGISDRLFNCFKLAMENQNKFFETAMAEGKFLIEVSHNRIRIIDPNAEIRSFPLTKSSGVEIPQGGTTNVDFYFAGCDIYISNELLALIADGAQFTAIIAALTAALPAATPVAAITAAAASIVQMGADHCAKNNPNGIVISIDIAPSATNTTGIKSQTPGKQVDM